MLNDQTYNRPSTSHEALLLRNDNHPDEENDDNNNDDADEEQFRDIHALTPPQPAPATANRGRWREAWETSSHRSSSISMASDAALSENFTSMSREFSALVLAGSAIGTNDNDSGSSNNNNHHTASSIMNNANNIGGNMDLGRIGEDDAPEEETNPLAIVPDNSMLQGPAAESPRRRAGAMLTSTSSSSAVASSGDQMAASLQRVKKEEVESKISAWQNAKVSKVNNRFKREDAIISGWESEQVQKATSWMKKVERKLEEKRARALEKMQNDIAKARRKAEERRASAEAKRGTKVARVLEIASLMRAVGRAPVKRSFF